MGLLGLAYHPKFQENGKLYVFFTIREGGQLYDRVEEWAVPPGGDLRTTPPVKVKTIIETKDPAGNHNGGQIRFGPDGFLYIGFGDGGGGGDTYNNGQNLMTILGDMARIDVDRQESGKNYAIPADNPYVGRSDALPEIYASGLRNPWRWSFTPEGQLVLADVGQNAYEEVDIIEKGGNYGWNLREGRHQYRAGVVPPGVIDPIYEYGRSEGYSVTGGHVYSGNDLPALNGKYVFGDYSGRIWAIDLPDRNVPGAPLQAATALGKWPVGISTFGRDPAGNVLVADHQGGTIYKMSAP
jgi:glucose/arabinose dehydrogenase